MLIALALGQRFIYRHLAMGSLDASLQSKRFLLAVGLVVVAYFVLGGHLVCCFLGHRRKQVAISLIMTLGTVVTAIVVAEAVLPPNRQYTRFQRAFQEQIARRNTETLRVFRHHQHQLSTNALGFADRPRSYEKNGPRFIFIGDSFLEVRSRTNLARRVERMINDTDVAVDVINLSKDATDPQTDYRHKFHEFAFEYEPDRVFIFIYGGNDLVVHYRFEPYRHPEYVVTEQAIAFLRSSGVRGPVLATLKEAQSRRCIFRSREELLALIQPKHVPRDEANLAYLACLAFSHTDLHLPFAALMFPHTWSHATSAMDRLLKPALIYPTIADIEIQYASVFERPRGDRLEHIARLAARRFCFMRDERPFLVALNRQGQGLKDQILAEPDLCAYLMPALADAAGRKRRFPPADTDAVRIAVAEYLKLFEEFDRAAKAHGAQLTVVLIPEASLVDETFRAFWRPMTADFAGKLQPRHAVFHGLCRALPHHVDTLDLTRYGNQYDDAYWKSDGHWNDRGNDVTA